MKNEFRIGIFAKAFCAVIIFALLFAILPSNASALGVVPGEKTYVYDGNEIQYNIRVINDELKDAVYKIEASGELSKYVSFSKNKVYFNSQKSDEVIMVKFLIPESERETIPPDEYETSIIIKTDDRSTAGITAFVGVISKLTITIPGDDAYIKMQTYVPNFVRGEQNSFSVDITNKGIRTATNCFAVIDILSSTNSKVVSLVSNRVNVQGTRIEHLLLPWTPDANNGVYTAKTSVICDGISAEDQKTFSIGSPSIKIVNFVSTGFVLGQINRFDLILESEWGEKIDAVYADIELTKDGVTLSRDKTQNIGMNPLEKISVPVYLDTKGMASGKYSMYIMLHYLDKDVGTIYEVEMSENSFVVQRLSGMVVGETAEGEPQSGTNVLLVIVIVIVVILNVVLVLKLMRKKEK